MIDPWSELELLYELAWLSGRLPWNGVVQMLETVLGWVPAVTGAPFHPVDAADDSALLL